MGLIHKQVILVGNSGCGKSSLVLRLTHSFFSENYIPTEFESHTTDFETQSGSKVKLTLQDVSGAQEGATFRHLAYEGCDAIILCFDVNDMESYHSLETKWIPEISSYAPGLPVFIAACKKDSVPTDNKEETDDDVFEKEVETLVERVGALGYIQCSASTNQNVELLFQQILETKATKQQNGVQKVIKSTKKGLRKLYSSI